MTDNDLEMKEPGQNNIVKINEAVLEKRIDEKIREGIETTINLLPDLT